ncbi:putative methyltransferase-like protein C27D7.08c [Grifola frondosa]|uniref:Putative methyltransferase-like protein C27D7.08c n=1 Tax=Grifola frondosa TaxID=5627 RepID=A0A1C7LNQ7_GRIFR|nr:putative methyltransferase-like protein C27D7.08c [Grifola frondosa]
MQPRNPYRTPPDFVALAAAYPPLQPHLIQTANGATINFMDDAAQRRLTEALLHHDFRLSMTLPNDRICPPVPNRLNYVLWIEDIIEATSLADPPHHPEQIKGLDMQVHVLLYHGCVRADDSNSGTGASAIYPLLGCQMHRDWSFVATDIDEVSLQYARLNVRQNALEDRVTVVQSDPAGPIFLPLTNAREQEMEASISQDLEFDFTMCNPPFYRDREEMVKSAEGKESAPNAVLTGADVELITPGGEVAFVGKMILESLHIQKHCRWYTSMLGKMSSLKDLAALLREHQIDNYAISDLVQGQTRRWVMAWSFGDARLPDSLARIPNPALQSIMPLRNTFHQVFEQARSADNLAHTLRTVLASISGLSVRPRDDSEDIAEAAQVSDVLVSATRNTWSRAARRRNGAASAPPESSAPVLVCRISCLESDSNGRRSDGQAAGAILQIDWVKGIDRALFESFSSHVGRKVTAAFAAEI